MHGPYFVIGGNAYVQSRIVMTPFNKVELKGRIDRDSYKFFSVSCESEWRWHSVFW